MDSQYVNSGDILSSFSPESDYLALSTKDGSITIWDIVKGRVETQFACTASGREIKCIKWLPLKEKGKSLLFFGQKKRKLGPCNLLVLGTNSGEVLAFDVASGLQKWGLSDCHRGDINAFSYDAKNVCLYSDGADGMISIIDPCKGKQIKNFQSSTNAVSLISISPDGKFLAIVSEQLKIFRCTGRNNHWVIMKTFTADLGVVRCVAFTKDGKHIVSSAANRNDISVWKIDNGKVQDALCVLALEHPPVYLDTLGEEKGQGFRIMAISESVAYYWSSANLTQLSTTFPVKVEVVNEDGPLRTIFSAKEEKVKEKITNVYSANVNVMTVSGLQSKLSFNKMLLRFGTELRAREYFSWGILKPSILRAILHQTKDVCWAIAIISHLEAMLKLDGSLKSSDTLSIQALIDLIPTCHLEMGKQIKDDSMGENDDSMPQYAQGSLKTIELAGSELIEKGTVFEEFCGLDYKLGMGDRTPVDLESTNRFKASSVTFYDLANGIKEDVEGEEVDINKKVHNIRLLHDDFEKQLEKQLRKCGPVACRILVSEKFNERGLKGSYNPTDDELENASGGHLLLLTGVGVDENGYSFWEFQDSYGKKWGNNGVIKVMRYRQIVTTFIKIDI